MELLFNNTQIFDGTQIFNSSVTNAITYFTTNPFILTAIFSNRLKKWYKNSSEHPNIFNESPTKPDNFITDLSARLTKLACSSGSIQNYIENLPINSITVNDIKNINVNDIIYVKFISEYGNIVTGKSYFFFKLKCDFLIQTVDGVNFVFTEFGTNNKFSSSFNFMDSLVKSLRISKEIPAIAAPAIAAPAIAARAIAVPAIAVPAIAAPAIAVPAIAAPAIAVPAIAAPAIAVPAIAARNIAAHHVSLNRCLVVFDFDCTLTTKHYFYYMNNINHFEKFWGNNLGVLSPLVNKYKELKEYILTEHKEDENKENNELLINEFFGGNIRFKFIRNGLRTLREDGCKVIIASRGYKDQIIALLRCVGLEDAFTDVYGNEREKDELLFENITSGIFTQVFYADDDNSEHTKLLNKFRVNPASANSSPLFDRWVLGDVEYNFFKKLVKNNNTGITLPDFNGLLRFIYKSEVKNKYLKYKQKYLELKKAVYQ